MNKEEQLARILKAKRSDKDVEILKRCRNRKVLDVGCVGQVRSYESKSWLHNQISEVAKELTGVDIDRIGIDQLASKGYRVLHVDELRKDDKFEVIVMGDVIEHIGDIQSFLAFYARHLTDDGILVITTPNPFSFRQVLHVFFYSKPSINREHTSNLDPITMLELIDRGNYQIEDFCWLDEQTEVKGWKNKLILAISKLFISMRRYYSQNFLFVIKAGNG
jgi:2-polyprenyl-3-methyl-5-hydroxy-6-metoxy-1,4-benzoquinol methylase